MKSYRSILDAIAERGGDVDAVQREMEYIRFKARMESASREQYGTGAARAVSEAMHRQWDEERDIFADLARVARRIRRLHPPASGDNAVDLDRGVPTHDTPLLFGVAECIEAACKARRNRVPFGGKARRGAPSRGVASGEKRLRDLGATKREAADLLVHAGHRRRQAKLGK